MLHNIDVDYGRENKIRLHAKLKLFFDYTIQDNTLFIELKSRRCGFNEYNVTMLNISKLNKC